MKLNCSNDLRKHVGVNHVKFSYVYQWHDWIFKKHLLMKKSDNKLQWSTARKFDNGSIVAEAKLAYGINKATLEPGFSIKSTQIKSTTVHAQIDPVSGASSIGFTKQADKKSKWTYGCSLSLSEDSATLAPQVHYKLSPETSVVVQANIDHNLNLGSQVGLTYNLNPQRMLSCFVTMKVNSEFEFEGTNVILAYQHDGYVIKLPIFLASKAENKEAVALTFGACVIANVFAYFSHKKALQLKNERKKKDNSIHF